MEITSKNTLTRIISILLSIIMMGSIIFFAAPIAHASENDKLSIEMDIKANATESSILYAILRKSQNQYPDLGICNVMHNNENFNKNGVKKITLGCEDGSQKELDLIVNVVYPNSYKFETRPLTIKAENIRNRDADALLGYVNTARAIVHSGMPQYEKAVGTVIPITEGRPFTWDDCETEYDHDGGQYIFTQIYNGVQLTRSVVVIPPPLNQFDSDVPE